MRGCVDVQRLILSRAGLMVGWFIRPVREDVGVEGLKIKRALPCEAEDSVPLYLVEDSDCTASAAHTLMTR